MIKNFTVDGVQWSVPCEIDRVAEVRRSEVAGMMMNLEYFDDVWGTWLKYTVTIPVPQDKVAEYSALYEILTSPNSLHTFVMPYNQGHVTFEGRVERLPDKVYYMPQEAAYWKANSFEIISNKPIKKVVNGIVVTEGVVTS